MLDGGSLSLKYKVKVLDGFSPVLCLFRMPHNGTKGG
jgi:hypothetical protein